ncbi:MAG: hypothetical protein R2702_07560 [Acidimicrobiales bacterium]
MRPTASRLAAATALVVLAAIAAGCSSSDAATPTTTAAGPTTTAATTEATTTEATTATTAATPAGLPSCDEVLRRYTEAFTPDDLQPVVDLFRAWAPAMPTEVGAAVTRIADAYEEAGNLGELDLADRDLTDDAQTFSDWTNDGCPAA